MVYACKTEMNKFKKYVPRLNNFRQQVIRKLNQIGLNVVFLNHLDNRMVQCVVRLLLLQIKILGMDKYILIHILQWNMEAIGEEDFQIVEKAGVVERKCVLTPQEISDFN